MIQENLPSDFVVGLTKDIEDIEYLLSIAKRTNVRRQLEEFKLRITNQMKEQAKVEVQPDKPSLKQFYLDDKYSYEITDNFVIIIFSKVCDENFSESDVKFDIAEKSLNLEILERYKFSLKALKHEVIPQESYFKVSGQGMKVYLKKKDKADPWKALEYKGDYKPGPNDYVIPVSQLKKMYMEADEEGKKKLKAKFGENIETVLEDELPEELNKSKQSKSNETSNQEGQIEDNTEKTN